MNKYTSLIILIVLLLVVTALLIWQASEGNTIAAFILGVVTSLLLVVVGFSLHAIVSHQRSKHEQANFIANAKENLAIMASMQQVQNQQNTQLLKQIRQSPPALPSGDGLNIDAALAFDEGIFDQLEDDENI